jgi:hypothetical protein
VYIIFIVVIAAGPCHLDALVKLGHFSGVFFSESTVQGMLVGIGIAVVTAGWVIYFMLNMGFRAFRQMEF